MSRPSLRTWIALTGFLAACCTASHGSPVEETGGLEAWFTVHSLHLKMRGGETVSTWKDSSGNGHHLVDNENGLHAVFRKLQVGGKPAVQIGKANSHSVREPFRLEDHTIFLVYSASCSPCALFQGTGEDGDATAVVLRDRGKRDLYRRGTATAHANRPVALGEAFGITVLARRAGILRSFVNGADVSTRSEFAGPIYVERFFRVSRTRAVTDDGEGLRIAEMIFYDRYLDETEREAITRHLADWYEIDLDPARGDSATPHPPREEAVRVRLGSDSAGDLNGEQAFAIAWNLREKLEPPFRHDSQADNTRLFCTKDGTRVRLYVALPMTSPASGTDVRVLLLKNDAEYLSAEGASGPLAPGGAAATVRLATELVMNDGDYVEVVTLGRGAPGKVTLVPGEAAFSAEVE